MTAPSGILLFRGNYQLSNSRSIWLPFVLKLDGTFTIE